MVSRDDMVDWVVKFLKSRGGESWPKDVAKYIWDNYET